PATAEIIDRRDRECLASRQEQFSDETAIDVPGGGTRIVTSTRVPIFDEAGEPQFIIGVVNDLTDRKRAEDAIRHNAEILTATIPSMADAVLVTDEDGRVIIANPAARSLFGDRTDVGSEDWARTYHRFRADGVTPFATAEMPIARAARGES